MLLDQITYVILRGFDLDRVLDMDLLSFRSLHDSCVRLEQTDKHERLIALRSAYHADQKGFKDTLKILFPEVDRQSTQSTVQEDRAEFFRKFGEK